MPDRVKKTFSFIWRDDFAEENHWLPEEKNPHDPQFIEQAPSIVAAITAALMACGLLGEGRVITAIRPVGAANPWKMAGILDLMAGRELFR